MHSFLLLKFQKNNKQKHHNCMNLVEFDDSILL